MASLISRTRRACLIVLGAFACGGDRNAPPVEDDYAALIASRIEVWKSPTIFALFAMLNAAGYDLENTNEMHRVRTAVRSALSRTLPDSMFDRAEKFFKAHPDADPWAYSVVAMTTAGPPDFAFGPSWNAELSK